MLITYILYLLLAVYPVSIAALLTYPHITGSYVAERSKCNSQKRAVTQLHPPGGQHYNNNYYRIIIALQFMQRMQTKTSACAMMASKKRYTMDDIIQELEMVVECEGESFPDSCTSLITTACSPSG